MNKSNFFKFMQKRGLQLFCNNKYVILQIIFVGGELRTDMHLY